MPRARKVPAVYSKKDLVQLIEHIDQPNMLMIVIIALFCGLRRAEICRLRVADIDLHENRLIVRDGKMPGKLEKGYGKDRTVPIPRMVIPIFRSYVSLLGADAYWMFPSIDRTGKHLSPEYVSGRYSKYLESAGLRIPSHKNKAGNTVHHYRFHTLRHTYATHIWEKTGDIHAVQKALGHSDIETTMIYTHVSDKALQEKVDNAFAVGMPQSIMPKPQIRPVVESSSPIEILQKRLAKGEIGVNEYRQLSQELSQRVSYIG